MSDRDDLDPDEDKPPGDETEAIPDAKDGEPDDFAPVSESEDFSDAEANPDESDLGLELDEVVAEVPESEPSVEELDEPATEFDDEAASGTWTSSTAALLLGALDPADAAAAGQAIANDVAARAEIVSLLPVADILTSLYQSQSAASASQEATAQGAVTTRSPVQPKTARPKSQPVAVPKGKGISPAAWAAIGLGILAALGILWALAQRDQTTTREQEIRALQTRVADLEIGGNASVFVLNPVSDEAAGGKATVFYSPGDGTVLLSASGLPALDDDLVYQVWYQPSGDETWQPGPTFRVNDSGEIVRRLGSEAPGFENMAISIEPAPGSSEPTGDFLLQGALVRAADQ